MNFYNNSTLTALIVLAFVLFLIALLLWFVTRNVKGMVQAKGMEEEQEPSFMERVVKPVTSKWNPTIVTLVVFGIVALSLGVYGYAFGWTEVGVQQGYAPDQPINFSHKLHAGSMKIDCQYCHSTAAKSKHASIPSLNTCMNCHKGAQLRDKYDGEVSPELAKLYAAVGFDPDKGKYDPSLEKKPIKWVRIHNLPDLSYFNHSQHVAVGNVECQTCHGPIEEMEKVYQFSTLQMGWCINCHRERGIDVENNEYYEEVHKEMKSKGRHYVSVAENGGLECAKCHY